MTELDLNPSLCAGGMPADPKESYKAAIALAAWLSAALDDPKVCAEYKQAINNWFSAAMPYPPAESADRPPATQSQIEEARELYALQSSGDIEIDDDAVSSVAEHGTWVQAWVWLANPEKEEV